MPSKSQPRNGYIVSSEDIGHDFEDKRYSRQHSTSNTVKEKALSPRASLKFLDKIKADIPCPPHANLTFEFEKNGDSGVFIRTKTGGSHHHQQAGKKASKEGELVKHMSSLPGFLQRGEKPQDRILNFGVLDWEHLETWKHKQKQSSGQSRPGSSYAAASSSSSASTVISSTSDTEKSEVLPSRLNQVSSSKVYSSGKVDTSGFLPYSSKLTRCCDFTTAEKYCLDEQRRKTRKDKSCVEGKSKNSHKSKALDSYKKDNLEMGLSSSNLSSHNVPFTSKEKNGVKSDTPEKMVKCNGLESDPAHQNHHKKQDSVILLLPKDFTKSTCLDESQCTSLDGYSAELNWSSFSDVFSVEELHLEESTSDIPHSCPLPFMAESETELDMNLDKLIHDQRMQLPSEQLNMSASLSQKLSASFEVKHEENRKKESTSSTTWATSKGLDRKTSHLNSSNGTDPSAARQINSGIGKLSRSLSFEEGSTLPQLIRSSIRSGPAQALNFHDDSTDKRVNTTGRGRISPFRRFLDPILKPKATKPINLVDSSLSQIENSENLNVKGINDGQAIQSEKSGSKFIKAVLQLTVKSGLPLFKFLVETNNEILASTVKRLSTLGRDEPSWLYSFYSVQEVKRKSGSWKYQGRKGKITDFSYNVIGQMKVSEPLPCMDEDNLEEKFVRESVLYGVGLSKVDEATSESAANNELGAIAIKMPKEDSQDDQKKYDIDNTADIDMPGSIVVILPGAVHSLPNEGVPASLINRWRSGGLCDCGGWDVGCRLKVLANKDQDDKFLRSSSLQHRCNLFLQGNGEQNRPIFRLLAHGEGLYSIEYDSAISSLQAFAISVAVLSDQKHRSLPDDANSYCEARRGHFRSKSSIVQGEGTRYASYPPHSPVSRA